MSDRPWIIRQATVVGETQSSIADVVIEGERVAAIEASIPWSAEMEIDATGMVLFPGLIDAHVHFNDPGREDWEGMETGSRALAAGGGTTFIDMQIGRAHV